MKSISEGEGGSPPQKQRDAENGDSSARDEANRLSATAAAAGYHSRRLPGGAAGAVARATDLLEVDDSAAAFSHFSGSSVKLELNEESPSPPSQPELEEVPAAPTAPRTPLQKQKAAAAPKRRRKMFGFRRLDHDGGGGGGGGEVGESARARSPAAAEDDSGGDGETMSVLPHIMTEQEIMHKYWKLAVSL